MASLVQLISRQPLKWPSGHKVLPTHIFIKVEIWDTLLISSLSILKKMCYIRMSRKLDKLISYDNCCITPCYSLGFHGENERDTSNVASAVPAVGMLVRFALVNSCLQWPCSGVSVSSIGHTKRGFWGCVLLLLLITPQQWLSFEVVIQPGLACHLLPTLIGAVPHRLTFQGCCHTSTFLPANTVLMWFNWLPSRCSSVVNLFC